TPPPPGEVFWPGVEIGKPVGPALHRIMEMIEPGAGPHERESLVRSMSGAMGVADRQEQLLHMVNNVLSSDLWERAVRSSFSSREVPFCVKDNASYMAGKVDLVFAEEDGAVIVDYKADNVAADETESRLDFYREQGEFYRNALGLVLGRPVKDVVFFFAAPGVALSLTSSR
ncbi:MAG: PD-(D/E)XK nuclease family protein, partial [Actinobacteria bacterium]|nr:PD-(D/E)XK nuclease family protein [Actinomycetota bacterium]